jgi:hypothetical protein
MDWRSIFCRIWQGLCVMASVISVGRAIGWMLDLI